MSLSIPFAAVKAMLRRCAKGAEIEEKEHHHWVRYKGRTFHSLPKGRHGARTPEVEIGHVVAMNRELGIDEECAQRHIPQLPKKKSKPP
jgi:hypothetical protein